MSQAGLLGGVTWKSSSGKERLIVTRGVSDVIDSKSQPGTRFSWRKQMTPRLAGFSRVLQGTGACQGAIGGALIRQEHVLDFTAVRSLIRYIAEIRKDLIRYAKSNEVGKPL